MTDRLVTDEELVGDDWWCVDCQEEISEEELRLHRQCTVLAELYGDSTSGISAPPETEKP